MLATSISTALRAGIPPCSIKATSTTYTTGICTILTATT
jgi:hypothetical protein